MKQMKICVGLSVVFTLFVAVSPVHAFWWMVYYKPAFEGRIIDTDTHEPIKGAVVVAVYDKSKWFSISGQLSGIIDVREALTDKEGWFRIPSYLTLVGPFSYEDTVQFFIFKPGYTVSDQGYEKMFTGEKGTVGLTKLKTKEEIRSARPPDTLFSDDDRLMKKLVHFRRLEAEWDQMAYPPDIIDRSIPIDKSLKYHHDHEDIRR